MHIRFIASLLLPVMAASAMGITIVQAEQWQIPVAGNAFPANPNTHDRSLRRDGVLILRDADQVHSVFFHVSSDSELKLSVDGRTLGDNSTVGVMVGDQMLSCELATSQKSSATVGTVRAPSGYMRVDLQLTDGSGPAQIEQLIVEAASDDLQLDFVKNNDGNMFYWGRRGPSVHLAYRIPRNVDLKYAYSEITVPVGQDPIGSYFMANGFGEGYFGMQVNSETERRVLFSVWSPFRTDDPTKIPKEDRVLTLAKGTDVIARDFGNEGSGGQSFLRYAWKAGRTYRFLTEVVPDGSGNTRYTSWFGDKEKKEWKLIASFQRPKTDKHLSGFHSFLENFSPAMGHVQRSAQYGNQWVGDVQGNWHEVTDAKFTGDNTASGRHRLDFAGGIDGKVFYLKNGGFFSDAVELDQRFQRQSTPRTQPEIDWQNLPR
ncbi:DUF3472 domain-containing protein [Crateriforma conspicua]|uniref:DUF3472 domain-containing protein n=1 Tax=Crateriforma conspicua TaxID=2527996 RepID=UPI00118C8CEC|nr:DUF3472 domain-containing protein [Crateriforma conspicua]QDV64000.1 hypothetical protein Mal65_31480 [Crateriforma conspicua]